MSVKLAPSILSADFGRLADEIAAVEAGGADWIHVDVMDGHFVPNLTIGPVVVRAARRATRLPLDIHLMIEEPERFLEAFVEAGADRITVHRETCPHLHRTVETIRAMGASPGVALNPATPISALRDVVALVDLVLVMSVDPGFGGQDYIPASTERLRLAAELVAGRDGADAEIQVDGGIRAENAAGAVAAGATVLVAGSAVFGHASGPEAGVRALRDAVAGGES